MQDALFWIGHASFYIEAQDTTVFIDPFKLPRSLKERADIVLITHSHFDHCSKPDIDRVMKDGTRVIAARGCLGEREYGGVTIARPGFSERIGAVDIEAIPAYNIKSGKLQFHPRENGWVGYIVGIAGMRIYHAGDTDFIPEMKALKGIEAALLPVGGTYTMDVREALEANKAIRPKFFVPMHYKNLLGAEGSASAEERIRNGAANALIMKEVQEPTYSFR